MGPYDKNREYRRPKLVLLRDGSITLWLQAERVQTAAQRLRWTAHVGPVWKKLLANVFLLCL